MGLTMSNLYHSPDRSPVYDIVHFLNEKLLTNDLSGKGSFIRSLLNATPDDYRNAASKVGKRLDYFDVESRRAFAVCSKPARKIMLQ
jgi:hypothetical protein